MDESLKVFVIFVFLERCFEMLRTERCIRIASHARPSCRAHRVGPTRLCCYEGWNRYLESQLNSVAYNYKDDNLAHCRFTLAR